MALNPRPPFCRVSARLVRRHRPLNWVVALDLRSEIEFLGRVFSGVDQLLPTLPMQGPHGGDGGDAGGLMQTLDFEISVPTHAQGVRRQCLLSSKRRRVRNSQAEGSNPITSTRCFGSSRLSG